jgi:hypothetical protein
MAFLTTVCFAIFFACCIAQFWFINRIKNTLIDRHPDAYLALERKAWYPGHGIWRMASIWRNPLPGYLNDDVLAQRVRQYRYCLILAFAAWLGFAATIVFSGFN